MAQTNRPWASTISIAISRCMPPETKQPGFLGKLFGKKAEKPEIPDLSQYLDQVYKLARNYAVSLDLGCSNLNLVNEIDRNTYTAGLDGKDRYLLWVKNWKLSYKELSVLIRYYKHDRMGNQYHILRLKETAQILLNARHNAKLATWAIKHRRHSNLK